MPSSSLLQAITSAVLGAKKTSTRHQAAIVYSQLMRQARHPWFYTQAAIPDSFDGRFEMLVIHLFAYLEPRKNEDEKARLRQALLEYMLDDMDRTLREMGVGDMGVSRRIKQMGNAVNGRFQTYATALTESPAALEEALKRNAYGTVLADAITTEVVAKLAAYIAALPKYLATQDDEDLKLKSFTLPA